MTRMSEKKVAYRAAEQASRQTLVVGIGVSNMQRGERMLDHVKNYAQEHGHPFTVRKSHLRVDVKFGKGTVRIQEVSGHGI